MIAFTAIGFAQETKNTPKNVERSEMTINSDESSRGGAVYCTLTIYWHDSDGNNHVFTQQFGSTSVAGCYTKMSTFLAIWEGN